MNCNNNNTTTETKLPLEEIIIPDRVADFITKKMDKKKFAEWRDQGIFIQAPHPDGPRDHKGLWLLLQDMGEQERTNCRDMIFDYLKKVEERIHVHNRDQHKCELDVDFYLIVRLLIPSQKCGFVRGKQSETIRKIETDWELDYAKFDKGERIELPPDHGRLIIKGQKVEGMRMAILEVQSLVKKAKGFNPFGLADAHAKDPNEVVKERIFLPLIQVLNERQKKEFRQLQESSGVSNWTVDKGAKLAEGRFIWLEGKASQVVEAKKRIFFFFRQLENDGGSGDTGLSIAEIVIPFPVYREVIGFDGDNIKKLKIDLGVDLRFLGENSEDYPDGRTLRIIGHGEERVRQAREFLEQEYVHNRPKGGNPFWSPAGHNRRSNEPEQQQQEEEEDEEVVVEEAKRKQPPPEDLHQREVVIPILVARFATDVTEQCGLFECKSRPMTRRGYGEQTRTLDLYGTKEAVDKAAAMFDVYTAEYEENKQRLLARSAAWKAAREAEEAEAAAERKRQDQEEAAAERQRRIQQQQQSKKTEGEGKENKQKILRCFGTRAPKNNDAANAQANANASSGSNSGGGSSSSSSSKPKKPKQQKVMFDESCTKNAAPAADDDDSFATDDSDKQFNYSRKNDDGEGQHQQDNTHQALDHMSRMFHRTKTLDEEEAEEEEKNDNSKMTEESDEETEAEKTEAQAEEKEREEERERKEEERQKKQEEEEAADLEDATQSLLRGMPIFNVLEQRQEKADTFQREHRELDEKVEREVRSMSRWLVILYREKEALLAQNEALRQEVANLRSQQQGN